MKPLSRREAVLGLLATAAACASIPRFRATELPLRVPVAMLGEDGRVVVEYPSLPYPLLVSQQGDEYVAVHMECTHAGCPLTARRKNLVCDCHGSKFEDTGQVLTGPAEDDLVTYPTRLDEDEILIEL